MRRLPFATCVATVTAVFLATASPTSAQSGIDYNRLEVGQILPGGYVITQRYGARGFLARRGGDLFYVNRNAVTRLNPNYAIGPQIEDLEPRLRRYREN